MNDRVYCITTCELRPFSAKKTYVGTLKRIYEKHENSDCDCWSNALDRLKESIHKTCAELQSGNAFVRDRNYGATIVCGDKGVKLSQHIANTLWAWNWEFKDYLMEDDDELQEPEYDIVLCR